MGYWSTLAVAGEHLAWGFGLGLPGFIVWVAGFPIVTGKEYAGVPCIAYECGVRRVPRVPQSTQTCLAAPPKSALQGR